jgi:hypothetical protein
MKNVHTWSVWKPPPPCCKKRAMASMEAPQTTDERIRSAPLLFCHIERQVFWVGSAADPFSSPFRGGSSLAVFEAILVVS